jgi:FPC/CPF motif-containing protein YcgG
MDHSSIDRQPADGATPAAKDLSDFVERQFQALVLDKGFPCLGARSALQRSAYRFHLYSDITARGSLVQLAVDLNRYTGVRRSLPGRFATFVASFQEPRGSLDEAHWDRLLWQALQRLHFMDDKPWAADSRSDPADAEFSYSFDGVSYFVVGLHPGASRHARRFAYPTIVFNAHDQFQALRESGEYVRFQRLIRHRDERLQGSINPNLADFGEISDASQYSGSPVDHTWHCPFQADP